MYYTLAHTKLASSQFLWSPYVIGHFSEPHAPRFRPAS